LTLYPAKPALRDYQPLATGQPLVSVIVPARNEEHNIERCVRSVLASSYPSFEVIVVNDKSTDGTGAVLDRLAAADPRVKIIHGAERPDDWFGKPWACWQGFEQATGAVLLFTDADTVHSPQLMPLSVAALVSSKVDLVTILPRQEMISFWERVVQPFFFLILGLRYGSPARINRNRNPRNGIANGQYIMVTRASYVSVDGHRAVKGTVIEDLMLAVTYLKAGKYHLAVNAEQDMATRMYTTLPEMVEGWSKNYFVGARYTVKSTLLTYLACTLSLLLPGYFLLPLVATMAGLARQRTDWLTFGLLGYAGASLLIGLILRAGKAPMRSGLLHPLGALITARIIFRSMVRGTRRIEWKGRTYSHG